MGGIFSSIGIISLVLVCFFLIWKVYGYCGNDQSTKNTFEDDNME